MSNILTVLQSVALPLFLKFGLAAVIAIVVKDLPKASEKLIAFVDAHAKSKAIQNLVAWVVHNAEGVVLKIEADTRPYVKELEQDGSLSKDGRANLRAKALADLKAQLGPATIDLIHSVLGIQSTALDGFLSGILEGAVGKLNAAQSNNASNGANAAQAHLGTNMISALKEMAVGAGMLPEPKTELAAVTPITSAPSAAEQILLPTDKQLEDAKNAALPNPK